VFKSKPIQIKTANRSKKTENRTKPNIIGCVWMTFCENRLVASDFRLIFQNRTEPHTNILIYIFIFIIKIYYIKLLFFLFNSFNTMYDFNLINFVSFSYVLMIINHYYSTRLFFFINHMLFLYRTYHFIIFL